MKHKNFLYIIFIFIFSTFFVTNVFAQTQEETDESGVVLNEENIILDENTNNESEGVIENITESVTNEDVEVEIPSSFGLFFRNLREYVSLGLTFDPVKKAEKQLKYAEERMQFAEVMAESKDEKVQIRAEKMIEKAHRFISRVEEKKEKWINNKDEKVNNLRNRIINFQSVRGRIMDRIEDKIPQERREKIIRLREVGLKQGGRILKAIDNENIPDSVKEHLQNVKKRIEERSEQIKIFKDKKHELLQKAKEGDESAKESLKQLNRERLNFLKNNAKKVKTEAGRVGNAIRNESIKASNKLKKMDGREDVQTKIKRLRKVKKVQQQGVINKVQKVKKVQSQNSVKPERVILKKAIELNRKANRQ